MATISAPPITKSIFNYPPNFPAGVVNPDWIAWFQAVQANSLVYPAAQTGFALGWDASGNLINVPNTGADQTAAWTAADAVVTQNFQTADAGLLSGYQAGDALIRSDLQSPTANKGASLIGYLAPYTGAVGTTQQEMNSRTVDLFDTLSAAQKADVLAGTASVDCTAAILAALTHLKPTGGMLKVRRGTYLTDAIDLRGFNNLSAVGDSLGIEFPYTNGACFKIRTACAIGIQMSDTVGEIPTNVGQGITIDGIYLDCNNLATVGMNMRQAVRMKGVCVRHALGDGIVLEASTYPVYMDSVNSQFNGGHGIHIKSPLTTVYGLGSCEFGYNTGYGMLIEGGATSNFDTILVQSNARGGVKIIRAADAAFTNPIFLGQLLFKNLYTEANGTLALSDPNYEGNYPLRVEGYDQTSSSNTAQKIVDLTFMNCALNGLARPAWVTATAYVIGNVVATGGYNYRCLVSHTAGTFATDLAAGKWVVLALYGGDLAYIRGCSYVKAINTNGIEQAYDPLYNYVGGVHKNTGPLDLSSPSSGQVAFPATQVPSSDVNTLDDYEEGTFAFQLAQSGTSPVFTVSGTTNAKHIKIGKQVTCFVDYAWSSQNGANAAFFCQAMNLPYPCASGVAGASVIDLQVAGGGTDRWSIIPIAGTTTAGLVKNSNSTTNALCGDVPAAGHISAVFSYVAAQ